MAGPRQHDTRPEPASRQRTTLEFAHAARVLASEARRHGLVAPSFRCPPRIVGVDRSLRRHGNGVVVAVQLKDRPWLAVLADMVEGVVAANSLQSPQADRVRTQLWTAVGADPNLVPDTATDRKVA